MDDKEFNEKYEQLKKSKFKQQKLAGWRPIPTISCITIIYLSFALFFIIFGVLILVFTGQVKEIKVRYDKLCYNLMVCPIQIHINDKMTKPIMIYYQLDDFSQNHRIYMDSKSEKQLKGEQVSKEDLEKSGECENKLLNKDIGNNNLNGDDVAVPCGLIADSYFRDNFTDWKIDGKDIYPKITDIAYKSDIKKYGNTPYEETTHWTEIKDEHFMIWLRPSPFPNPRKIWGKIESIDIEKDSTIYVTIQNNKYLTHKKYIILSTRNVFGGKNLFLGLFYIIFGVLCLFASITFIICFNTFHRKHKL